MMPNGPSSSECVPHRKLVPIDPTFDLAYRGEWDLVFSLLASGAIEPNFRDMTINGGPTLLDLAFEQDHHLAIFVLRLKYGAHTSFELHHHEIQLFHQWQWEQFHRTHQPPPPGFSPQFDAQRLSPQPDIPKQSVQLEQAPPPEKPTLYTESIQP